MAHHIQYVATRSLVAGRTIGATVTWDFLLADLDRMSSTTGSQQTSLAGAVYTTFIRQAVSWQVTSAPASGATARQWREFLDSASDGQSLGFGAYTSSTASPTDRRAVVLDIRRGYRERRTGRVGGGGQSDYFQFSFNLLELP